MWKCGLIGKCRECGTRIKTEIINGYTVHNGCDRECPKHEDIKENHIFDKNGKCLRCGTYDLNETICSW